MTYVDYWPLPPEEISSVEASWLKYPPRLTEDDITFVQDTICVTPEKISREQWGTMLYFLNAYTYGGLIAQRLYYGFVRICQARDKEKLVKLWNTPFERLMPEVNQNTEFTAAEIEAVFAQILQGLITINSVLKQTWKNPQIIENYTELLPCRSLSAQVCVENKCTNLYINCHQQIQRSEFEFERPSAPFINTETMLTDKQKFELVPLRQVLLQLTLEKFVRAAPQSELSITNQKLRQFILNRYKAEIKIYYAFIDWFNGSDWNKSNSSA